MANKKLAVIGDPISHSLSPLLHNAMARELNLPYVYEARQVPAGGLPEWLAEVRADGWAGFNATMPHKLDLIARLDRLTEEARYYGAVNSVKNESGVLTGHNTDADGFARMLGEHGFGFAGARVALLGAGGAASAIAKKAAKDGAAKITIFNRTVEKAEALCAVSPGTMTAAKLGAPLPADTDILVSTLPAGSPFDLTLLDALPGDCAVFDALYSPPKTALLEYAGARGRLAVNGLGMLVHQAILAFSFFTGEAVDPGPMAKLLYGVLDNQNGRRAF